MHALILMTVLAQWAPREAPHYGHTRESRRMGNRSLVGQGYAFFEAFPLSGAGTTSACSTTAPTGAKGEVLTFTRTGNATCSKKGLATTGIADGDLVVMSGNVARVEPDSDGVLGLRVEGARTNSAVRSQEFSNAAWRKLGTGRPAPVVYPSDGGSFFTAPDGTATAQHIAFSQCDGGGQSLVDQLTTPGASAVVTTFYVKPADGGTQAADVCAYNAAGTCTHYPSIPGGSWTRISHASTSTGNSYPGIGCSATYSGSGGMGGDLLVWGAQHEAGAYATSYIPTTSAAVTRNAEVASFPGPSTITGASSMAASVTMAGWTGSQEAVFGQASSGSNFWYLYYQGAASLRSAPSTGTLQASAVSAVAGTAHRIAAANDGTDRTLCFDSTCATAAHTTTYTRPATVFSVGSVAGLAVVQSGLISRVCVDPDPTRCR